MCKNRSVLGIVAYILLTSCLGMAQQEKKTLPNADVVTMIKAGLPESTVVLAIQNSPANYDTSPQANRTQAARGDREDG